jgi:hypothetical protein
MYGDSYCGAYDMTVIIIVIIPIAKSSGILLSSNSYTHTHRHTVYNTLGNGSGVVEVFHIILNRISWHGL